MFPRTKNASWIFRETSLIMVLYALWQYVGSLDFADFSNADKAGLWLAELQRTLFFPSEAWIQAPVLGHEWLMRVVDTYYSALHIPVFIITLIWVLVFHRRDWNFVRTTTAILTGACLVIQFIPVAPPRLLPGRHDEGPNGSTQVASHGAADYSLGDLVDIINPLQQLPIAYEVHK
jgi:hypothetical protein